MPQLLQDLYGLFDADSGELQGFKQQKPGEPAMPLLNAGQVGAVADAQGYPLPAPSGIAANDRGALAAAVASGATIIQLRAGTYLMDASIAGSLAGKTIRGISRDRTTVKLVNGHNIDFLFVGNAAGATFEHFTFDGNAYNSANGFCALVKADTVGPVSDGFRMRRMLCKNGASNLVRLWPGSADCSFTDNIFQDFKDLIFEATPWVRGTFARNVCVDYGRAPTYSALTGPVFLFYQGSDGWKIEGNTFLPFQAAGPGTGAGAEFALEWVGGANSWGCAITGNVFDARNAVNGNTRGTGISGYLAGSAIAGNVWRLGASCTADCGLEITGPRNTITGNTIEDGGIELGADDNVVKGNVLRQTRTAARAGSQAVTIGFNGANRCLIEGNHITYVAGIFANGGAIHARGGVNSLNAIRGNTINLSGGNQAVNFEQGSGDSNLVEGNTFKDPYQSVQFVVAYTKCVVRNNVHFGTGVAPTAPGAGSVITGNLTNV